MFFASEKYVDEQVEKIFTEVQKLKSSTDQYTKKQAENNQFIDARIYEIGNILDELKKSLFAIKDEFDKQQQIVTDDVVKLFDQINDVKEICMVGQEELRTELDTVNFEQNEKQGQLDLTPIYEKISELDTSTLEHFKIVHDTMMKFSEIIDIKNEKKATQPDRKFESKSNNSYNERRLHELDEKISGLSEKMDAAIELIFEKIASLNADNSDIPEVLQSDRCPFKSKQGHCELWASRKNKRDALLYCSSCMQASELLDKGVKL